MCCRLIWAAVACSCRWTLSREAPEPRPSPVRNTTRAATRQTPALTPGAICANVLAPAAKLNLTLEQRHTIRELVKDMKVDAAEVKAEVGDQIPQGITPHPMPNEVAQKVPQVKSHRFILTAEQIVIVDPKDNKVADVIKLAAE